MHPYGRGDSHTLCQLQNVTHSDCVSHVTRLSCLRAPTTLAQAVRLLTCSGGTRVECRHAETNLIGFLVGFSPYRNIGTGYGLEEREAGVRVPVGSRIFISPYPPDRLWAHQASYPMRNGGYFPGSKAAGASS
jgi:hypothetical protein